MAELRTEADAAPRRAWPVHVAAGLLVVAILGPLAWPGYALSYDMVFVPRQHLTWTLVAPADALPRAVPLDAVVALANLAIPGWLLQRVALAGLVYAAAVGAASLVPSGRVLPRVVAAVGYVWTAYLAERLLLGQWSLLCCYAALPWIVAAAIDIRRGARAAVPRLVVAAAAASLTPTGGLIATTAAAVLLLGRRPGRTALAGLAAVAALNAPWVVASLVASAGAASDPAGVAAFAARAENSTGTLGALLGTGGVWNRLTTPDSRMWTSTPVVTVVLLVLAVIGWPRLRSALAPGVAYRLAGLAAGGFVLAIAGAVPPGAAALRFLVVQVPGAGLLRDGQKFLAGYVLLLVLCVASGVARLADRFGAEVAGVVGVGAVLLPLFAMPDLAWGGAGALHPVRYPADWATVERIVDAAPGDVLALPFGEYRRYGWTGGRVVIDPLPRYLAAPVVADDTLVVGAVTVAGEDRRAARVREHLAAGGAAADLGVAWVVVEGPGVPPSALAGLDRVYSGPELTLYRNPAAVPAGHPTTARRAAMLLAYTLALGMVVGAAAWWST
ncbi:MAG TPA: hypothetical protein VH561_01895 [Micromonosporaceae bacterium]|jgi:hypothetical protein